MKTLHFFQDIFLFFHKRVFQLILLAVCGSALATTDPTPELNEATQIKQDSVITPDQLLAKNLSLMMDSITMVPENDESENPTARQFYGRPWGYGGYGRPWGYGGYGRPWGYGGYGRPWGYGGYGRPWGYGGYGRPYGFGK